jgi:hypothetical protein
MLDIIKNLLIAFFVIYSANQQQAIQPLVINELMASNSRTIRDPQGQYDDWIEIYNFGNTAVNIGGMYLTDDLSTPTKWRFPTNTPSATTIPAQGYLLVWADEDIADSGLHANFKLDSVGEELFLFDTDGGSLIDSITFGEQTADISYGRYPDANDTFQFMAEPTPGGANNEGFLGEVAEPEFSHIRGFYDAPFSVAITTETEGAVIYYTLDGSEPGVTSGVVYSGQIQITKTTCLRAKVVKTGWMPSKIVTHTYIFNASETMKSLPVISLVGDEHTTFFEPDGIMAIVGGFYDGSGVWQASGQGSYNNPIHRGIEYERPVSFEILDSQNDTNFQIDCGIRVHGSDYTRPRYTRGDDWLCNNNKFSFNLYFRSDYGDNRLEYPFFPFIDVDRFKSIVLRAGHNDICSPFVKDEWARRLFREMGRAQLTGSFASLYINGKYKGYYNPSARLDEEFLQEWYNTDSGFDVINQSGLRDGTWDAWNSLLNYIGSHNLSNTTYYDYVADKLDIPTFIDFLIIEIYIGNFDWPGNNWEVHRERSDAGIFRFSIWDAEGMAETWIFGNNCEYCYLTAFENFPNWANPRGLNHMNDPVSRIYRALKANPNFRQLFADRIHKHFRNGGVLTESHLLAKWWEVQNEVAAFLPYQSRFVPDVFLPKREPYVLAAFEQNGLFDSDFAAPVFNINGSYRHGGHISTGDSLTITNPNSSGTVYYTLDGSDPRLPSSSGTVNTVTIVPENAPKHVLVPTSAISDAWRGGQAFDDSSWIAGTGGVGYERSSGYEAYFNINVQTQMYNKNGTCYIRIPFSISSDQLATVKSLNLNVRYDDGFVAYINGVEVQRAQFTGTLTWNSQASSNHDDALAVNFESFDISGFISSLRTGNNILAIHGLNTPTTSSDFLISVELIAGQGAVGASPADVSPTAIEYKGPITLTKSTHVKSRVLSGGTWSALNEAIYAVGPVTENLRITEIMYHPLETNDPNEEYIELKNIGTEAINLNLVRFTNGIDFTFGDISLAPGGYSILVKDRNIFTARYGSTVNIAGQYLGSLSDGGERIRIEDAVGQTILDFEYKDGWLDITDGGGYSLTIINAADSDPDSWSLKESWCALNPSPGR